MAYLACRMTMPMARRRKTTKSSAAPSKGRQPKRSTALDLVRDLIGSVAGPADLSVNLPHYVLTWRMNLSGASSPHWLLNPSAADRRLLPLCALRRSVSAQRSCTRPHGSAQ